MTELWKRLHCFLEMYGLIELIIAFMEQSADLKFIDIGFAKFHDVFIN